MWLKPDTIQKSGERSIKIFGDSFTELPESKNERVKSWMYWLAELSGMTIESYGIAGAAESTCLYRYTQTYREDREHTIIFHTYPGRTDVYYNLRNLTFYDYMRWDKALKKHASLHIYWSTANHYHFKNGLSINCYYWMKLAKEDSKREMKWDSNSSEMDGINHMTDIDNFKLAKTIWKLIERKK